MKKGLRASSENPLEAEAKEEILSGGSWPTSAPHDTLISVSLEESRPSNPLRQRPSCAQLRRLDLNW
ncbi:MAG: hypothetical protein ACI9SC_002760 [Gammaproteobacteria bacterium]|jgi:hypothetical protein